MIKVTTTSKFADSTVTASSTESGFSVSNVLSLPVQKRWRSTSASNQWLKFDLGSAMDISSFAGIFHNLTSSATIKLYGHSSDLGSSAATWAGSATFNSSNTLSRDFAVIALHIASAQNLRWWFLELDDPTNTNGFIEIGQIFGGAFEEPDENFNENFEPAWIDTSRVLDTEAQSRYTVEKARYKNFNFSLTDFDAANISLVESWWQAVYKTCPFLVAFDTDLHPADWTRLVHWDQDELKWIYGPYERASTNLNWKELR